MIGWRDRLVVVVLAILLDQLLGEPPVWLHPVVGIGRLIAQLERRAPAFSPRGELIYGGLISSVTIASAGALATLADRWTSQLPALAGQLARAALLKPTFAVRALFEAVAQVRRPLGRGELSEARTALRSLVSRDPSVLDPPLIAAAAIESLAENLSDSIVAPVLAYLVGGLPSAYVYRAANTLDAMIGYRGRYEYLGKIAARLDDLANLIPSRLTAGLVVLGAAVAGENARRAATIAFRDHRKTVSPNAGWPMSAMAGALGVELEKRGHYRLGVGLARPTVNDLRRAERVGRWAIWLVLLALGAAAVLEAIFQKRGS